MTMKSPPNESELAKVYLLNTENAISVFAAQADAKGAMVEGDVTFDSAAELKRVTADWPSSRFAAVWNSLPGWFRSGSSRTDQLG